MFAQQPKARPDAAVPLQRMKQITTIITVLTFTAVAVVLLLNTADPLWSALLLVPSMLAALWAAAHWHTALPRPVLLSLLAICLITWAAAAFLTVHPLAMLGLAVVGSVALINQSPHRLATTLGLAGLIGATGLLSLLTDPGSVRSYTVNAALTSLGVTAVFWMNDLSWRLFTELDAMRRSEAELAVMKERFRFAADLHDIQGHTLHVIKLKAAVAARLQHSDPDRTAAELAEIQRLTAETIDQGRELANSTFRLSFESELANAVNLLEAAGIRVSIGRAPGVKVAHDAVFALVLREATTNILRHSQARNFTVTVTEGDLTVMNDGAAGPVNGPRGLAGLSVRAAEAGGVLTHTHKGSSFTVSLGFGA